MHNSITPPGPGPFRCVPYADSPDPPWMASRLGAAHRPRLHAAVDRRGPRRGARARDDRGCGRRGRDRLRHGARLRPRRGELGHNERLLPARCGAARRDRADRHEGRHDAGRRRVDSRRPREGDPRRLRGEPRRARRPADRPLPAPRARSAHAVADLGARAGAARRRGSRARVGVANVNRASSTRRSSSHRSRRSRSRSAHSTTAPLRGGVVERCAERGIAVIAHSPLGGPRRAGGWVAGRRSRASPPPRCDACGGRARVAARALAGRGRRSRARAVPRRRARPPGLRRSTSTRTSGRRSAASSAAPPAGAAARPRGTATWSS